jgi:hypothetical protein
MSDKTKGVLASIIAGMVVLLVLAVSMYRDVRSLARDTRARAEASSLVWERRAALRQAAEQAFHEDVLREIRDITADMKAQRLAIERLNSVTPVEAIKDRAKEK